MGCVLAAMTVETCPVSRHRVSQQATHKLVGLVKARILHAQPVRGDARERGIVKHDDRVGVVREPLKGQQRVVRLHDDVRLVMVGRVKLKIGFRTFAMVKRVLAVVGVVQIGAILPRF